MIARRTLFLAAGAEALVSCATPAPVSEDTSYRTPPSGADAEINFYDYTRPQAGQSISITYDDGSGVRTVGADLRPREFEFPSTPRYPTRTSGTMKVTITLTRDGRTAAVDTLELPLKTDWIWGVAVHAAAENPMQSCIGCMGAHRQPLPADLARVPGEAMWIVWSGNSIRNPGVA
jgi:hypothetical protein